MIIQQIETSRIRLDPTQPRKFVDMDRVSDMAASVKKHGIINPIEVDKDLVIVTGEMRYRAGKKAGLKTIPCRVIDIGADERFERQVVENVHHNTMSAWDTAKAIKELLRVTQGKATSHNEIGLSTISKRIGKTTKWIRETLSLLESPAEFQEALKDNKVNPTYNRAIRLVDNRFKKRMSDKIIGGGIKSRDLAFKLASTINEDPSKADMLLGLDLDCDLQVGISRIQEIATTTEDKAVSMSEYCQSVEKASESLIRLLSNPPEMVDAKDGVLAFDKQSVVSTLKKVHERLSPMFGANMPRLE